MALLTVRNLNIHFATATGPLHAVRLSCDDCHSSLEGEFTLGWLGQASELHVSAFAPDELRHMGGTEWDRFTVRALDHKALGQVLRQYDGRAQ